MEKEFVTYLKSQELQRFMSNIRDNYKRLGQLGGTIKIGVPSQTERYAIETLTGKTFFGTDEIKMTYNQFQKSLALTRYADIDFVKVLTLYFGEPIVTNQEKRNKKKETTTGAIDELEHLYKDCYASQWLQNIRKTNPILFTKCIQQFLGDKEVIINCLDAINQFPLWSGKSVSLAVFATNITKDPHFFDKGLPATILNDASTYFLNANEKPTIATQRNKVLSYIGLLKEDGLNYCITSCLFAKTNADDEHLGLAYFSNRYEPLNLNIGNILQLGRIVNVGFTLVVENPAVFHALNEYVKVKQLTKIALICTSGEINSASYALLDILHQSNVTMYYAGDFDPEGLVIADKLKRRYTCLKFLGYDANGYKNAKSDKILNDSRLKKLDNCTTEELNIIKKLILQHKNPGYQEALIANYASWLSEINTNSILKHD